MAKARTAAAGSKTTKTKAGGAAARPTPRQTIRCYLCGHRFEVSLKAMSTTCPSCHRAIKVEDVKVKSYLPVNDLQTCGMIHVTRRGRVAAKNIQSGGGIVCEGALEGVVETEGTLELGPKASWKGPRLQSRSLLVADGASLVGHVTVPWTKQEEGTKGQRG